MKPTKQQLATTRATLSLLIEAQQAKVDKLHRTKGLFSITSIVANENLNNLKAALDLLPR